MCLVKVSVGGCAGDFQNLPGPRAVPFRHRVGREQFRKLFWCGAQSFQCFDLFLFSKQAMRWYE